MYMTFHIGILKCALKNMSLIKKNFKNTYVFCYISVKYLLRINFYNKILGEKFVEHETSSIKVSTF